MKASKSDDCNSDSFESDTDPTEYVMHQIHNSVLQKKTRGRNGKVTQEEIWRMRNILKELPEDRQLSGEGLGIETDVEACGDTIKKVMSTLNYHMCIACYKG